MVLSGKTLKHRIGTSIKLKPFRDKNLGGVSYDITLADEFLKLKEEEVLVIDPMKLDIVGERTMARDFILQPNSFVLARSDEWLDLSGKIMCMVSGKSSLARLGLQVHSAAILHPGHSGYIVLEIKNNNSVPVRLVRGMKIAQLVFFETSDEVESYSKLKNSSFKVQRGVKLPDKLGFSD